MLSREPEIGPNGLPLPPPDRDAPGAAAARPRPARPAPRGEPALAALGLGFASLMLLGPLTGLPAIGYGIAGLRRAKSGSPGRTQATTGIVLGVLGSAMWTGIVLAAL